MLRHLNTLLKGKNKNLRHNILKYLTTVLPLCCFCLISGVTVCADQTGAVEIVVDADLNMYDTRKQLYGEIYFNDTEYYNEYLYMSYHLVDAENEEMIQFENERVWISAPNDKGIVNIIMDIVIDDQYKDQNLIIQLDIVDILNQYWLSDLEEDILISPTIYYEKNFGKKIAQELLNEIADGPIVLGINCIFFFLFVGVGVYIKKNKVL